MSEFGKLGISREQAYGILGSLAGESGRSLNTNAINPNDPGGSYGIGQWHSGRKRGMFSLAAKTGRKKSDFRAQVDYVVHELKTTEKKALTAVRAAKDRYQAARAWTNKFERPAAKYARHNRRNQNADYFANLLSGAETGAAEPDVSLTGATLPAETIAEDPRSRGLLADLGAPQDAGLFSYAPQEQEQPSMFGSLFGITPAAASEMPGPERFGYDPDLSAAQAEYARAVQAPPDYHAIQKAISQQPVGSLRIGGLEPMGATETLAPTAATETVVGQDVTPTTTPKTSRLPSSLPDVARFGQPEQTPAPERFGPLGYAPVEHPTPNLAGIFGPEQGWALNALDENDLTYRDPTISLPEEEVDPDLPMAGTETIADDYPTAPEKPKDEGLFSPETKAGMTIGSLLGPAGMVGGGLIGRALAGSGGLLGGNPMAGPVSPGDRYGVGSGMMGIQSAMYGPRGATGYSRSNPGSFVTSRGPQFGYDLTNQFGATTHYTPSGNIAATRDSNARLGGLLNGLFGGGILGGNRGGMSDRERAEWSGRSGLF